MRFVLGSVTLLLFLLNPAPGYADTVDARCDVYPRGSDHTDNSGPCVFSQHQGYVTIIRGDGIRHELTPTEDRPGNFLNGQGRAIYRESGLGRSGQIYRFPNESVYVYWQTIASSEDTSQNNPAMRYSTEGFDATTFLPCKKKDSAARSCPAGILRMGMVRPRL